MVPYILLASGHKFNYLTPEANEFTIEDVATGLSNVCRFGGQLGRFYSVAQHAYYVSYAIDQAYALDGLCHDNVEAFLMDIPTPLKVLLPDYKALEATHEAEMFKRLGLQYPMHPSVRKADLEVFGAEVRDLQPKGTSWDVLVGVSPYKRKIEPWSPVLAKMMFLKRYNELKGVVNE